MDGLCRYLYAVNRNHLSPEQRPDRNGNLVTRWVKRTFAPKKEQRTIPQVKLPSLKERYMEHMEADLLQDKLTKGLPKEYVAPVYDPSQSPEEQIRESLQRHSDVRKHELLKRAYKNNDFEKLRLLDKHMEQYDPQTISGTIDRLRKEGVTDVDEWITPDRMHAVEDFFGAAHEAEASRWGEDETPRWDPEYSKELELLAKHVTMHPEDGPALGTIMQRGVRDADSAMKALAEFKAGGISSTLQDGFL